MIPGDMSSLSSGLSVSISKLTDLLQLSLNPLNNENAKRVSGAVLELIAHTTELSMLTTCLVDEYKTRESNLRECLADMSALVKVQQKKLQKVRPPVTTANAGTGTDEVHCLACAASAHANSLLRKDIAALQATVESFQGKLVQSKYLLQAQQVLIDNYETNMNENTEGLRTRSTEAVSATTTAPQTANARPTPEPWRDLFADNPRRSDHSTNIVLSHGSGIPPKQPGRPHRYSGSTSAEGEDTRSVEHGEGSDEEGEEEEEEEEEEERSEYTAAYLSPSHGEIEAECRWGTDYEDHSHEQEAYDEWAEEGSGEQDRSYLDYSFDESAAKTAGEEEDEGDGEVGRYSISIVDVDGREASVSRHRYQHEHGTWQDEDEEDSEQGLSASASDTSGGAREQEQRHPAPDGETRAWQEDHEGSLEDSFSLIRDFYDVNYS